MAILIDENSKVVVQGITGREGQFHALRNRDYGTKIQYKKQLTKQVQMLL